MRKMVTAVLASSVLATGVLAGCSSRTDSSEGAAGGTVTLNVWAMGEEAKSLPQLADKFTQENPNIKINVQALPWDTAHDKLITAVASKKGPDVLQLGTTWIPEFASANALMDLKAELGSYPEFAESNFYPGAVATTRQGDAVVGVPWYIDTRVLYYRKDLLQSVGYNEAPKTWEELSDAAKKLAARGNGSYGLSIDTKEQSLAFMFARQNGSKLIDNNKPLFNQPEFVQAVEYLNSFFQDGSAPKDLGMDIVPAFQKGIAPMFISGPWMIKLINDQAPDIKDKWATAVLPKKENNTSSLGGSNLSVFQHTEHKEEALKFIAYMSKPATQLEWLKLSNTLPSTKKAWEDPSLTNDPNYKVIGEQLNASEPMPLIKPFEEIAQSYLKSFENIYRANANVQTEMDAFNKKAEQILSK
ncbi:sugar ABC transporter substrate-binding protein [Paenibacillus xerothermodurans]|uniref:ABC transporter substrate-binding protein n=1 Tax=Paenibacillus xerothermodurans TaxID=1977292 RepID=A0A2W1NRZ1_PAEXE|nr:sugar ABC transporter substrate-binding protein [Paenibacillus xerothermodurans]PZE22325.1 ABC transporter substrate-binding protein [Paenibacillus xerothermodurans]